MKEYIYTSPTINEINDLKTLIKEVVSDMNTKGYFAWDVEYPNEEIMIDDIKEGNARCIKHQGIIIGYLAKVVFDKDEYLEFDKENYLSFGRLMVKPAYQHQGIASYLIEQFLIEFNKGQYTALDILVDANNVPAIKLYESRGLKNLGKTICPWGEMLRYQLEL